MRHERRCSDNRHELNIDHRAPTYTECGFDTAGHDSNATRLGDISHDSASPLEKAWMCTVQHSLGHLRRVSQTVHEILLSDTVVEASSNAIDNSYENTLLAHVLCDRCL